MKALRDIRWLFLIGILAGYAVAVAYLWFLVDVTLTQSLFSPALVAVALFLGGIYGDSAEEYWAGRRRRR